MKTTVFAIVIVGICLTSCVGVREDRDAKALLQGIWANAETGELSFYAIGDTLYFPDRGMKANYFCIVDDSLEIHGADIDRYAVYRQSAHLFYFYNLYGELVKLRKSTLSSDSVFFANMPGRVYKDKTKVKDSLINYQGKSYHYHVSIAPNNETVLKQIYTHDGIQVAYIFPDYTINLKIQEDDKVIYNEEIKKVEYGKAVPSSFLNQAVFSDFDLQRIDGKGMHFIAVLAIPNARISYNIETLINYRGKQEIISEE